MAEFQGNLASYNEANGEFTFSGKGVTLKSNAKVANNIQTASATAGAATLNAPAGIITSESLTTAAGADYTLTLTNSFITATSAVLASVGNGTNTTGDPSLFSVTPAAGSATIIVRNGHATVALNGTLKISFIVL